MLLLRLFLTFFKIGLCTFGGGYAMVPLIQSEIEKNGWMDARTLVDFIAVSESTPGPIAVNLSTFVGGETAGVPGAVCATLGVVLPSFIVILLVLKFLTKFKESRVVRGALGGLSPAVVGLIAAALLRIGATVFFPAGFSAAAFASPAFYCAAAIFVLASALSFKKLHPVLILLLCAALGVAAGFALGLPTA